MHLQREAIERAAVCATVLVLDRKEQLGAQELSQQLAVESRLGSSKEMYLISHYNPTLLFDRLCTFNTLHPFASAMVSCFSNYTLNGGLDEAVDR